ncbi:hypothetical protein EDB86DRAFT_1315975 [Lactarius hatsudake]|nr:hypothetical protein EDB86DRAFT_1315975 [Lactarius hatsudake]
MRHNGEASMMLCWLVALATSLCTIRPNAACSVSSHSLLFSRLLYILPHHSYLVSIWLYIHTVTPKREYRGGDIKVPTEKFLPPVTAPASYNLPNFGGQRSTKLAF